MFQEEVYLYLLILASLTCSLSFRLLFGWILVDCCGNWKASAFINHLISGGWSGGFVCRPQSGILICKRWKRMKIIKKHKCPLMLIFHNHSQLSVYVSSDKRAHEGTRTSRQKKKIQPNHAYPCFVVGKILNVLLSYIGQGSFKPLQWEIVIHWLWNRYISSSHWRRRN